MSGYIRVTVQNKEGFIRGDSIVGVLPDTNRVGGSVVYTDSIVGALSVDENVKEILALVEEFYYDEYIEKDLENVEDLLEFLEEYLSDNS